MMKALRATPWPVLILIASFLCPTEFSADLGGFRLSPHRVVLLFLLPVSVLRMIVRPHTHLRSFDFVFLFFTVWTVIVFMGHLGQEDGLKFGGSLALESFGGYVVARAWVRNEIIFRATLKALLMAVVAAGMIALPETLFGKLFVHDTLRALTGYEHPTTLEQRLGLTRAYGTFDHPIHFGTFAASVLAMLWFAEAKASRKRLKAVLVGGITFLGVSSAPILCLLLQGGFIFWEWLTRAMARRVTILVSAVIALYTLASMVMTRSPFAFVATGLTIDPWTGYYRLQIWEHGMNNVFSNPLWGIGLADWERPWWMVADTVDAYWLVLMMRQGIPSILLLTLGLALLVRHAYKHGIMRRTQTASPTRLPSGRRQSQGSLRPLGMGWLISLTAMILVACTVHYWNVLFTYFFFVVGLGGVFADPSTAPAAAKVDQPVKGDAPQRSASIWGSDDPWGAAVADTQVATKPVGLDSGTIWARS